jgi:peptidoglycan/LPS O-acetylase OafA/YrhL
MELLILILSLDTACHHHRHQFEFVHDSLCSCNETNPSTSFAAPPFYLQSDFTFHTMESGGRIGWIGVDLFFVLSGFLISGLLFQEYKDTGSINFKRFILRRGLKIWPSFYVFLIFVAALWLIKPSSLMGEQILYNVVWLENYHASNSIFLIHTWSLAVEEHFYLLLPALLLLLVKVSRGRDPFWTIPALFILISTLCVAFRRSLPPDINAGATHMRIDSLFAGVALGYLYHFRRNWFQKLTGHYAMALASLSCISIGLFRTRFTENIGLTVLFVGFSFLVAWAVVRTTENLPFQVLWKCAAQIGFYSYSIYVWHTAVLYLVTTYLGWLALPFWIYLILAVLVGIAMANLVELPFLKLREKQFPSHAKRNVLNFGPRPAVVPLVSASRIVP